MALETYRKKRDFARTAEPRGRKARADGHSFVIQKHAATRLHYDFRLELDGVLKSWAVTRGPSLVPGEKRLAVHVEDHPLEYGDFEGTIPKGEYGGGEVIVWDRGTWEPIGDPHRTYKKGKLDFELDGEKLHGRWHLVRMRGKRGEKRENWLLIKGDDEAARDPGDTDILIEAPQSVKTGRDVKELKGEAPGWSSRTGRIKKATRKATSKTKAPAAASRIKRARNAPLPAFVEPQLATLTTKTPAGKRWIHEIKFDGYRLQARIDHGNVTLLTRRGHDWTEKFGSKLISALKKLPADTALLDGELVVENDAGASDFSALQAALSENRSSGFVFYAFDLLHLDGLDLTATPQVDRKERLRALLSGAAEILRYSDHFQDSGDMVLRHACRLSLEGVVSKDRDAPYRAGRNKSWMKSKCSERQEFVIAGYVPSTTMKKAIGSLVLGYYEKGKLVHAGRVGTGYTVALARGLFKRLDPIRTDEAPFSKRLTSDQARDVRFVRPELVAEVEFRGWTADRSLRHASFRGLREDKPAREVVREFEPYTDAARPPASVKLTHPDRIYWPDAGVTKEGLADYYADVWKRMAPFVAGRPLALVRCPDGVTKQCFFQKHAWQGLSKAIRQVKDVNDSSGKPILAIDDLDGLIGLVQAGVLEIHPWGSTLEKIEEPDMIILDLDPGEGVSWQDIVEAAREVRVRLDRNGLTSFVKTSGGKGLHVVAPLKQKAQWPEVKAFTKALAEGMAADAPDHFVAKITKSKRRGKILVDYLRNGRGATAVAPYSTRARPGAAVSMPLAWDELTAEIGPAYFTIENAPARLANLRRDPWADFRKAAALLPEPAVKGKIRR
jgi:bifunctional non-homologous end joining protein LigD